MGCNITKEQKAKITPSITLLKKDTNVNLNSYSNFKDQSVMNHRHPPSMKSHSKNNNDNNNEVSICSQEVKTNIITDHLDKENLNKEKPNEDTISKLNKSVISKTSNKAELINPKNTKVSKPKKKVKLFSFQTVPNRIKPYQTVLLNAKHLPRI